jgi:serine phosphatase RsbU (regulator of sigma subunit)
LRVPRRVIQRALQQRRELLSMTFDPLSSGETHPEQSVADLELRSVVCVPLVRISAGTSQETSLLSTQHDTVGVLYMDSRVLTADLSVGNRELLQSLAIEASTILENARLLEEDRSHQRLEEELNVARRIQQSLLPRSLPSSGWFRASGSSVASHQVGGDYFDVIQVNDACWAAVVADVAGKGVSSALLASLLQGAFLAVSDASEMLEKKMERMNRFLSERTDGDKYATIFYCLIDQDGRLRYVNAGQCSPMIVSAGRQPEYLDTTAVPVGLLPDASFAVEQRQLAPGDRIVICTDGVTEAQNSTREFFGRKRLREIVLAHTEDSCAALHTAIMSDVRKFVGAAAQADDITTVILEYQPEK